MGVKLSKDFGKITKDIEKQLHQTYMSFIYDCMNNLRMLSPVDTGRYRNAHHFSLGSRSYAMSGTQAISIAVGDFPNVYIQNNLPYVERIENGWSSQAPQGVYGNAFHSAVANLA